MVIDFEHVDMIADGYSEEFLEICREFTGELPGLLEALENYAKEANLPKVIRTAHQIKGSAANFGFVGVNKPIALLESMAKEGNLEGSQHFIDLARVNFHQALKEAYEQRGVQLAGQM